MNVSKKLLTGLLCVGLLGSSAQSQCGFGSIARGAAKGLGAATCFMIAALYGSKIPEHIDVMNSQAKILEHSFSRGIYKFFGGEKHIQENANQLFLKGVATIAFSILGCKILKWGKNKTKQKTKTTQS